MDERLVDMEIRIAHQDKLIAELDDVVRAFTERIAELERTVSELRNSIDTPALPVGPADEPPPHY